MVDKGNKRRTGEVVGAAISAPPPDDGQETPSEGESVQPSAETGKSYGASIYPGPRHPLPPDFAAAVLEMSAQLEMPVWLLIQRGRIEMMDPKPMQMLDRSVATAFLNASRDILAANEPIALLVDSPGGSAQAAYRIAALLQSHCGRFTALIPNRAKSAATLLTLGAETIILGRQAELGPLDAQVFDPAHEGYRSALDEYQSLERLYASALAAVDQAVMAWKLRSMKKIDTLLPVACDFVADLMRPLFDKIDTVHYTETSRILKEAEEYAVRLLAPHYPVEEAMVIANALVENYPVHDFPIDLQEAQAIAVIDGAPIGLRATEATAELGRAFDKMRPFMRSATIIGTLVEVPQT